MVEIDDFIFQNNDLRNLTLSESEWQLITQVTGRLKAFRSATTQMSTTKQPMLSTAYAIFRGLQEDVRNALRSLPDSTSSLIKDGLLVAHQKLSEYYYRFDLSPYYVWAACESHLIFHLSLSVDLCLSEVLDPRILYEGLKTDYAQDADLLADLEKAKSALHTFYHDNYSTFTSSTDKHSQSVTTPVIQNRSPQKVDFTARYKRTNRWVSDELEDYFKLGQEDFDACRPLDWWLGRRAQFPNLYRLARDILAIPGELFLLHFRVNDRLREYIGSAVAVEWIFSGGHDTISL